MDTPTENSLTLYLSQEELVLVVRALKATTLPGLGEAPLGPVSEEVAGLLLAAANRALAARQLVHVQPDGTLQMDRTLATIASICLRPDQMLAVIATDAHGFTEQRYHYRVPDLTVTHTFPQPGLHALLLAAHSDMGQPYVLGLLDVLAAAAPLAVGPQTLTQAVLAQAQAATEVAQAQQVLTEAGWPVEAAQSFAQALLQPQLRLGLQFLYQRVPEARQTFITVLAHASGHWYSETPNFSAEILTFKPLALAEVKQAVQAAYQAYA